MTSYSLFLAIPVPADIAEEIGWLRESHALAGQPVRSDRLHATLCRLGDHPAPPYALADRVKAALDGQAPAACRVIFDRLVGSEQSVALAPSERPAGILRLQQEVAMQLAAAGVRPPPGWRFRPHVTLLYRAMPPFVADIDPISWRADEMRLVLSHVGRTRHDTLVRWRLRDAAASGVPQPNRRGPTSCQPSRIILPAT